MWFLMAVLSAFFAGLTSIFAKCGIKKTDSDIATAIRTIIVLLSAWCMVFVVHATKTITEIDLKSFVFLVLSGFATGASWICYFKALSIGDVNKVVPIDKSSTILTVLFAIILFQETNHLKIKLLGTFFLAVGIFLMIENKQSKKISKNNKWIIYAVLSAIFAAFMSVLAKIGISNVESNLGTAIRTIVVLLMSWSIVFAKGKHKNLKVIDKKEFIYIVLSGFATGASWLCYYYAIQNGVVSVVVSIDKLSILVTVIFSYIVFGEKLCKKSFIGLCFMVTGILIMALGV